jgi:hypothetical protein
MIDIEVENELQSYLYSLTRTTAHPNKFQIPIVNFDDRAGLNKVDRNHYTYISTM